ncbi:hypothetical protein FB451DRAFT_1395186 [Mycena latifolia]|nr:hypothetical protein FB451DRAFT_1395186 [Mycena latifolia]
MPKYFEDDSNTVNAGYVGAYDASTGSFVGAVAITLGDVGIFTLEKTGNTTNYLSVAAFSNACNDGGPVLLDLPWNHTDWWKVLATPNPAAYSAFYSNANIQQVYLSLFV